MEHDSEPPTPRRGLPFDPIEEAARTVVEHWRREPRMRAVTSLMRVHQLVLTELDELLRPLGLTFARYEVLVLLSFSRRGSLPLGKIGERLQVHATSVTPLVKRLEAAGADRATPHPEDGRAVLAAITPSGRAVMEQATEAIVGARFALGALSEDECDRLTPCCAPRECRRRLLAGQGALGVEPGRLVGVVRGELDAGGVRHQPLGQPGALAVRRRPTGVGGQADRAR